MPKLIFAHLFTYFYPRPPRGGRHNGCADKRMSSSISIHALRGEGDVFFMSEAHRPSIFLSTPSAGRATALRRRFGAGQCISIHALRGEGDRGVGAAFSNFTDFYPRPPRGGRPWAILSRLPQPLYFYPRPPRGGRHIGGRLACDEETISIHALRGEGDEVLSPVNGLPVRFLSTPSAGRATTRLAMFFVVKMHFYPRPPRGGRPSDLYDAGVGVLISIHALRGEGDTMTDDRTGIDFEFLSTPSAGRATNLDLPNQWLRIDFYPRPPRGGRPTSTICWSQRLRFLSTPSAGRATRYPYGWEKVSKISIHALRGEGDCLRWKNGLIESGNFYPRPPRGGRQ